MSNDTGDSRNGFKNSRIDLSQLGDDTWNKPMGRSSAKPGPRRKPGTTATVPANRRTHLDELFESRVREAAARRSVKQSRGQSRVWMFAGGLFLASVGGVAAAYYLVGPPMAMTAYATDGTGYQAAQTSSLEVDGTVTGTSSHFQGVPVQGVPVLATVPEATAGDVAAEPAAVQTPADDRPQGTDAVTREPVAPSSAGQSEADNSIAAIEETPEPDQDNLAAAEPTATEERQPVDAQPETERMVHIVPTAVSDEVKTKTNVNASKLSAASGDTDGQWVALPPESDPAPSSVVTAAASQQSNETKPVEGSVKSQQELFKAFQAYLQSRGHNATADDQNQEALFDKFMRWSVEAPKNN